MKNNKLETIRHSSAHLMAAAIQKIFPKAKFGVGPVVENGFYYDIDLDHKISPQDLKKIKKEMQKLQKQNLEYIREEISINEAIKVFKEMKQDYKVELLEDLKKHGTTAASEIYDGADSKQQNNQTTKSPKNVSIYKTGNFTDLCRGPHVKNSGEIKAFALLNIAGAYWRGDENNKMLQRIYGAAFESQEDLDKHLEMLEEAKKRDHKILGPQLDLFFFSERVGPGLPLWTPKGALMRDILDKCAWDIREKKGFTKTEIPHITKKDLFVTSGHWDKFKDELFRINTREGHEFALKPMNCPFHCEIFARRPFSYREMPQRYFTTTMTYRDEQTGELSGLSRVRSITIDDSHTFLREDQIESEVFKNWDIIDEFYSKFGFDMDVRLSLSDPKTPDIYLGDRKVWEKAENALRKLAKKRKVKVSEQEGEAAFYGPKVDFVAYDSLGREWQVATIQLDFNLPEKFDLNFTNDKGQEERIVMIHTAIMGSIERFMSVLIEHYAGAFPAWLSPVQVAILPVSDKHLEFANKIANKLKEKEVRAEVDDSRESVGKKIRNAEKEKIPFMLVIGDKEEESGKLAVRARGQSETKEMDIDEFTDTLNNN